MPVTILLVDDHRILRQGLRALLENEREFQVVGEADDGRRAIELVRELHPNVVVIDIRMPELNGIDATRQIMAEFPHTRVLALSAFSDPKLVSDTLRAGAAGYILKDGAMEELIEGINEVTAGRIYLGPRLPKVLGKSAQNGDRDIPQVQLSPREREVVQLIAEGKATKEVAVALQLSTKTVETHRRTIMEKLQLNSVAELTKFAIREGLTTAELYH